jgi:hypothetical protein
VAGDQPEDFLLYKHEQKIRSWKYLVFWRKIWLVLRFPGGPWKFFELKKHKHRALMALQSEIVATLDSVIREDGGSRKSLFIPH